MSSEPAEVGRLAPRQLHRLELVAVAYLLLPVLVWIAGWLRAPIALLLGAACIYQFLTVVRMRNRESSGSLLASEWLVLGVLAIGWGALSGLAGHFRVNDDWLVRLAVLRDLTVGAWPVGYGDAPSGGTLVMRFPMAYYLVPALAGKLFGLELVRFAQYLWTVIGVAIFFALTLTAWRERSIKATLVLLALVVLFSGLDIVGWTVSKGQWPAFGQHIEWWTWMFQYSSQTTLLYWVPNHAIPGWLAAVIVWRHREDGLAFAPMALLLLCVAAWAPLVAVGAAPVLILAAIRGQSWRAVLREAVHPAVITTLPVVLTLALFVTFGISAKDRALNESIAEIHWGALPYIVPQMLSFAAVEWLLFALVVWRAGGVSWLFWTAIVILLVLPTQRFGPGNDIVMRGGIVAITLILFEVARCLLSTTTARHWQAILLVLLIVGSAVPVLETQRAFTSHNSLPDFKLNLVEAYGSPWHYVGILQHEFVGELIRTPVPLSSGR